MFNISLLNLILIETIVLTSSVFHHSNIKLPQKFEKILSFIIVTPSIHWVHHHKRQKKLMQTIVQFLVLGFNIWNKSNFKRYKGMPIGVEGDSEQSLIKLISRPLK